jgi:hypothetical protein
LLGNPTDLEAELYFLEGIVMTSQMSLGFWMKMELLMIWMAISTISLWSMTLFGTPRHHGNSLLLQFLLLLSAFVPKCFYQYHYCLLNGRHALITSHGTSIDDLLDSNSNVLN